MHAASSDKKATGSPDGRESVGRGAVKRKLPSSRTSSPRTLFNRSTTLVTAFAVQTPIARATRGIMTRDVIFKSVQLWRSAARRSGAALASAAVSKGASSEYTLLVKAVEATGRDRPDRQLQRLVRRPLQEGLEIRIQAAIASSTGSRQYDRSRVGPCPVELDAN